MALNLATHSGSEHCHKVVGSIGTREKFVARRLELFRNLPRSLLETDSCSYRHYITHELPEDYDFEQEMETIGLLASRSE